MGAQTEILSGFGREKREHIRRQVRIEAVLFYLKQGIRGCKAQKAMALDLSEGGCMIACPKPGVVSEHLYVVIAGFRTKLACAVVGRSGSKLNLRFSEKLPSIVVDELAKRYH